jgi:hypothetical protein
VAGFFVPLLLQKTIAGADWEQNYSPFNRDATSPGIHLLNAFSLLNTAPDYMQWQMAIMAVG